MNAGIDTQRLRTLAAMGIDVWVRRGRAHIVEAPRGAEHVPEQRVVPEETPRTNATATALPPRPRADDVPQATWCAVAVGKAVLLARLDAPADRRFAQDLVLAAAGYPNEAPAIVTFAPTRAGSDEVAAFARGQIDRRRADRTILSRSAAAALALAIGDADEIVTTKLHGVPCVVVPEIATLRSSPDAKRNVWLALRQLH